MGNAIIEHEEAPPRMTTDPARLREERFQRRKARIDTAVSAGTLSPQLAAWYLDRTIWDTRHAAAELHVGEHRVSELRGGRRHDREGRPIKPKKQPHPGALPDADVILGVAWGVEQPGVEAGRVREWAVQRGTHRIDPATGKLTKKAGALRLGAPRHQRLTQSKPHKLGTSRKNKKTTNPGANGDTAEQ